VENERKKMERKNNRVLIIVLIGIAFDVIVLGGILLPGNALSSAVNEIIADIAKIFSVGN
jgi:hypothetical protein